MTDAEAIEAQCVENLQREDIHPLEEALGFKSLLELGAGLGSAADWQPVNNLTQANHWYHIVGEYTTTTTPSGCGTSYPGGINIWVNGVEWNMASHSPTGCMSQYSVVPQAGPSTLNVGTMAFDSWFDGGIGKVAIYNYLLSPTQITNHYKAMTGNQPTGAALAHALFDGMGE